MPAAKTQAAASAARGGEWPLADQTGTNAQHLCACWLCARITKQVSVPRGVPLAHHTSERARTHIHRLNLARNESFAWFRDAEFDVRNSHNKFARTNFGAVHARASCVRMCTIYNNKCLSVNQVALIHGAKSQIASTDNFCYFAQRSMSALARARLARLVLIHERVCIQRC